MHHRHSLTCRLLAWGALILALLMFQPSAFAQASSQRLIPFQGRLTNQAGVAYTSGQYSITFNLYSQAVGGSTLWTERHEKVGVTNGMVNVFLGSITPLAAVDFSTVKYLGITIDADNNPATADPEMVPRQMIIPAFHSKTADTAKTADLALNSNKLNGSDWTPLFGTNSPAGTISGSKITAGTIGSSQLGAGAVQSGNLSAGAVTTDKLSTEVASKLGTGGGGGGGVNYVTNGGGDNVTGWTVYKDSAQVSPITGSTAPLAGNNGITWQRGTTGNLRQGSEFLLTTPAGSNRQGEGVSYDFTIDKADQTRTLTISYDALVVSGTYSEGDVRLYLIAAPGTANASVIEPVGTKVPSGALGLPFQGRATFQALNGVTAYRLCLHVASTSTASYQLAFDSFAVGPQSLQSGTPITDYKDMGPITIGATTTAPTKGATKLVDRILARRVGDEAEMVYEYTQTTGGTVGAGSYLFSLPPGLTFDSSKVTFAGTTGSYRGSSSSAIGSGVITIGSGAMEANLLATAYDSNRFYLLVTSSQSGINGAGEGSVDKPLGANHYSFGNIDFAFRLFIKAPILGWGSSVQMSSDAGDGRVVVAIARGLASSSVTAGSALPFNTIEADTHGAYNASTYKFTAPLSGFYRVTVSGLYSAVVSDQILMRDAELIGYIATTNNARISSSALVYANAGNQLWVKNGSTVTVADVTTNVRIQYERLSSGGSTIGTSETVAARYTCAVAQALTTTPAVINYATVSHDTHGAVTTGAAWKFRAPVSGKYRVAARFMTGLGTTVQRLNVELYKNDSLYSVLVTGTQQTVTSGRIEGSGTDIIQLFAGDAIDLRGSVSVGTNTLSGDAVYNFVTIERIGN
jgi:hypothetical protein